jgi:recombination protein RecT
LTITANPVYENDFWHFEYGRNEDLKHRPANYNSRGNLIGFYAYAHLKNGGFKMQYMDIEEIEHIRNEHSRAYQFDKTGSIWVKHYDSMAKKTVIKQLIKYLPISVDIQNAIAHDETIRKDITDEASHIDIENDGTDFGGFGGEILDKEETK